MMDTATDCMPQDSTKKDDVLKVLDRMAKMDNTLCKVAKFMYDIISGLYNCIHPETLPLLQSGSMAEGCALPRYIKENELEMDIMSINFDQTGWLGTIDVENNPGYVYIPVDKKKLDEHEEYAKIQTQLSRPSYDTKYNYKTEFPYSCLSADDLFVSPKRRRKDIEELRTMDREKKAVYFLASLLPRLSKIDGITLITEEEPKLNITKASVEQELRYSKDGCDINYSFIIDTTASIAIDKWPKIASEWVHRKREWPSTKEIKRIEAMGCHVVPKTSAVGDEDKEWRYSFSNAELELIRLQEKEQRRLYLLFKFLYYKHIKDIIVETKNYDIDESKKDPGFAHNKAETKNDVIDESKKDPGLRSYSLKTTMLFFCEQYGPLNDIWKAENIFKGIRLLLETYQGYIEKKCLKNYFICSQNLLSGVPQAELDIASDIIRKILCNLEEYMPDMQFIEKKLTSNALLKELTNDLYVDERMEFAKNPLRLAARFLRNIYTEQKDLQNLLPFLQKQLGYDLLSIVEDLNDHHVELAAKLFKKFPNMNTAVQFLQKHNVGDNLGVIIKQFKEMDQAHLDCLSAMVDMLDSAHLESLSPMIQMMFKGKGT